MVPKKRTTFMESLKTFSVGIHIFWLQRGSLEVDLRSLNRAEHFLSQAQAHGKVNERELNFMVDVIKGIPLRWRHSSGTAVTVNKR